MGFLGLDVLSIRHLARQLNTQSGEVRSSIARVSKLIDDVPWAGNDRDRFLHSWNVDLVPRLRRASELLDEASRQASQGAQDQEGVSRS